jgi:hypothetical protein
MEDFPIGDALFEAKEDDVVEIWYSHNLLNKQFLILGTGAGIERFHAEAVQEFGDMVSPISQHKQVKVIVKNAT